jgi:parvulin-like peptidyl-prolyl isomerase
MAKKTVRSNKRSVSSKKPVSSTAISERPSLDNMTQYSLPVNVQKVFSPVRIFGVLILIGLAILVWRHKGIIMAGTINNQPIWRWDLEKRMVARSGNQVFEEMVNESLLKSAAAKKGITVTDTELNQKVKDIEKSLNGQISLADALSQQGMSMDEFRRQVSLQIMVEKLTADSVKVSEDDVTKYIDQNKSLLTATDEAGMRTEARQNLIREKQSTAFQKIFDDLKKAAKIKNYL